MKGSEQAIRGRKLVIENSKSRTEVQKGFDDMAKATLGNYQVTNYYDHLHNPISKSDYYQDFYEETKKEDEEHERQVEEQRKQEKEHEKKVNKICAIIIICIAVAIVIFALVIHHIHQVDRKISTGYSSKELVGENYETVIAELEDRGFSNITTIPQKDLIIGLITKNGEVEEINIDGNTSFSSDARYLPDVKIIITYHTFSDE